MSDIKEHTVLSQDLTKKSSIIIGVHCNLKLSDTYSLTNHSLPLALSHESSEAIDRSYHFLKSSVQSRNIIYGVNTQFGDQVTLIDRELSNTDDAAYFASINDRQINIIRSLACGLGNIVSPHIVRVTMMLRAHCLAQGYSGVSPELIRAMIAYINAGITPIVHQYGSIGASGDLIPLATIAAGIIGDNAVNVLYKNEVMSASQAIKNAGLEKFHPQLRDGLALINGTSFMTAIASLTLYRLRDLFRQMLFVIGMALESMLVINSAYKPLVHQLKKHAGEMTVNQILLDFWEGSQLITDLESDVHLSRSLQDYYSLRAVAQGFGPFYENLESAVVWVEDEMNSINDNPIIDAETKNIYHGANFMGYYVTDACDILKMNISQASTWIHALLANMVHPRKSNGLPTNLIEDPIKYNGFRSIQLLATSLTVQNRKLATVHSSYMLPSEGDNQDVNSLATHAALDLQESVLNLERLTALLLLASVQALEFRDIKKAGTKTQAIFEQIRQLSTKLVECRPMSEEIEAIVEFLREENRNFNF